MKGGTSRTLEYSVFIRVNETISKPQFIPVTQCLVDILLSHHRRSLPLQLLELFTSHVGNGE